MERKHFIRGVLGLLLIILIVLVVCELWPSKNRYYKMSIEQVDTDIRRTSKEIESIQERMVYYSERFIDAPYELYVEGDGPYAKYDQVPLLNLKKINCMTYCEIVMALSLSDYYMDFFNILQHIRYYQGIIGMSTRNHYTMADWLPANEWCLDDVTRLVGGNKTASVRRMISHEAFFAQKGITDIPITKLDREMEIDFIPLDTLRSCQSELQSGDVVALIMDAPGIFSAHMLLFIRTDDGPVFRHASMSAGKTLDSPFDDYLAGLQENPKYIGMSFMRMKKHIDWQSGQSTFGKFIVPVRVIPRSAWKANDRAGDGTVHDPYRITIHHTGVEYYGDPEPRQVIHNIQTYHQETNDYVDIAYHYLIDADGQIYQGRPDYLAGETETEYDPTGHLLLCLLGNFEEQKPTDKQLDALVMLAAHLCLDYDIDPNRIEGHRDLADTKCPGKNLYEYIDKGKLQERIAEKVRLQS